MKFDVGLDIEENSTSNEENTNLQKETTKEEEKRKENTQITLNNFFNKLINAPDLKITIDEKLLEEFEKFIEDRFTQIIMNDEIFPPEEQAAMIRWLDFQKYALMDLINKPYLNNKLIIAVTGRFAAGKSSFLNTILNTNLPVDVEATTAVPTYITYYKELHKGISQWFKSNSNYMLVNSIFGNKILQTKFLDEITKENVKNFPIPINQLLKFFVLSIKNPLLKNKVIIDTPGIDPTDKKGFDYDEKITSEALSLANVVLWIIDIDDGDLSNISLEFLEKNIKEEQDLIIIVNKVDKKPPKERKKVLNKIQQTIQKSNIKAKTMDIIEFSRKEKNLIDNVINYIDNISVENTTPFILELIDILLSQARKNVVEEVLKINEKIKYLNHYITDISNLDMLGKDTFLSELNNFLKKYPDEKELFEQARKYNTKLNHTFKAILDMFEYDSPLFGENKYYFPSNEWSTFIDKLNDLAINSSEFSSHIWHIVGYEKCILNKEKSKLEQLEELEQFINNTINEFENLKIKLKKII